MRVEIDGTDWDRETESMAQSLAAFRRRGVERAVNRALRKTGRWLRTQLARAVAQDARIPVSRFRRMRVSLRFRNADWQASLWLGTNPLAAHKLGKVRWTRRMRGARVGRRQFPGAFAWGPNPDRPRVFKRRSSSRLPIKVVTVSIDEAAQENARRLERRAMQRFRTVLRQELRYELAKWTGDA